jgi:raffinose/stachyose/melibiose transport system substrate-binding protein
MPESSELLWTLMVNHYAGPGQVRRALRGEIAWTSEVFADAIELLISWFDRGWFGTDYFTQPIEDGLRHLTDGSAAMSPTMTGMLPAAEPALKATPFPSLRADLPSPLYVFGTASLIGINAATVVAESASRVLDALFTVEVRRRFSARTPGDWNIPLADADADTLAE